MRSDPLAPSLTETALCRARLYRPARNTYQRVANRSYFAERTQARSFLRQFVPRGCTAFDIGANRGLYSELLLDAGARRVVSVEPHPGLAATVRRRYPRATVIQAAVGRDRSDLELHLGRDDLHSSVSGDWVNLIRETPGAPDRWNSTITVPGVTLRDLILTYGEPAFLKIDVEGAERDALHTLDRPIKALSFEYQCPDLSIARDCLSLLNSLGVYEFAAARGEQMRLATPWMTGDQLLANLDVVRDRQPDGHGDVYARIA